MVTSVTILLGIVNCFLRGALGVRDLDRKRLREGVEYMTEIDYVRGYQDTKWDRTRSLIVILGTYCPIRLFVPVPLVWVASQLHTSVIVVFIYIVIDINIYIVLYILLNPHY